MLIFDFKYNHLFKFGFDYNDITIKNELIKHPEKYNDYFDEYGELIGPPCNNDFSYMINCNYSLNDVKAAYELSTTTLGISLESLESYNELPIDFIDILKAKTGDFNFDLKPETKHNTNQIIKFYKINSKMNESTFYITLFFKMVKYILPDVLYEVCCEFDYEYCHIYDPY